LTFAAALLECHQLQSNLLQLYRATVSARLLHDVGALHQHPQASAHAACCHMVGGSSCSCALHLLLLLLVLVPCSAKVGGFACCGHALSAQQEGES
jgi:hypothetical protein